MKKVWLLVYKHIVDGEIIHSTMDVYKTKENAEREKNKYSLGFEDCLDIMEMEVK